MTPWRGGGRSPRPGRSPRLLQRGAHRQVLVEAALVVFGHRAALRLVALVEEGEAEGEADIAEDLGVLGPGDDRARRHDGADVAGDEARPREVREGHHRL